MWKEIPCTNGQYSANDKTGQIKSNDRLGTDGRKLKGKILKPFIQNNGYEVVDLRLNGERHRNLVHRLVAETFNEDFDPNLDINHINGVKTDNYASNLESVTRSENIRHAIDTGLIKPSEKQLEIRKNVSKLARLFQSRSVIMMDMDNNIEEGFEAVVDVKRKYGYDPSSITRTANHKQKHAYGHKFEWVNKCVTTIPDGSKGKVKVLSLKCEEPKGVS